MKWPLTALAVLFLLSVATLTLGGCGHWRHGHCGIGSGYGEAARADGNRHAPGFSQPYAP